MLVLLASDSGGITGHYKAILLPLVLVENHLSSIRNSGIIPSQNSWCGERPVVMVRDATHPCTIIC